MTAESETRNTARKSDTLNVLILILVASVLGVYLVATTVLISRDGVFYIERAKQFSTDLSGSLATHPPGYPLLILATHRLMSLFTDGSSVFTWIYSAQGITLFFRLLALIPLYFTGKWLIGSQKSFYAILILVVLPEPAEMACEVLREWPYMFFLSAGFMFLLWGARRGTSWTFGPAGLLSGMGYWFRPECGQIILYGLAWLMLSMTRPAEGKMTRWKSFAALMLLLIGFAAPALPYVKCTGHTFAPNAEQVIKSLFSGTAPGQTDVPRDDISITARYTAKLMPWSIAEALGEIVQATGETLMWFFLPFLIAGFFYHMRYAAALEERFFLTIFVLMNLAMMVARYCYVETTVSRRWTLPLVAMTIFYIPVGLQVTAQWLEKRRANRPAITPKSRFLFVLLVIGIVICLPKLLRPTGYEKRSFRAAAKWLNENTNPGDNVTVPDSRIAFYADRQKPVPANNNGGDPAVYIVGIITNKDGSPDFGKSVQNETANSKSNGDTFFSDRMKCFPLKDLIGYWPATLNTEDYSGHSNHGTLHGQAGYAEGKFGQAFTLNPATGDYIDCGNAPDLNPAGFITLSVWIYPTTASKGSILSKNGPYFLEMQTDRKIRAGLYAGVPPSWTLIISNSSLSLNRWHHVAMTYDGSQVKIYVNGKVDGSPAATSGELTATTVSLYLGYGQQPFDHYFGGLIDEVMIFDRGLSEKEIDVLNAETVGYWKERIVYSQWIDKRKNRKIVIYRIM